MQTLPQYLQENSIHVFSFGFCCFCEQFPDVFLLEAQVRLCFEFHDKTSEAGVSLLKVVTSVTGVFGRGKEPVEILGDAVAHVTGDISNVSTQLAGVCLGILDHDRLNSLLIDEVVEDDDFLPVRARDLDEVHESVVTAANFVNVMLFVEEL